MTDIIKIISVLIAVLAALYARWAWNEAKRANEIALHSNRMDIYRSLHNLRFAVLSEGSSIKAEHVAPFYHPSREARFYFTNKSTSQKIDEYYKVCFALSQCTHKLNRPNLSETKIKKLYDEQDALLEQEQTLFEETEKKIEEELYGAVKRR